MRLTDHEILEKEFVVYDSLFAECKRRVASGESVTLAALVPLPSK